jgi:hypothetical protein
MCLEIKFGGNVIGQLWGRVWGQEIKSERPKQGDESRFWECDCGVWE